jgi:ATP-dependent DNA helicase RecG
VVSPGGFPSTLTAETLLDGRSEIRNRVIARVFKELGYIEQWGSGIQRIRAACLAQGLVEPQIQEKGDFVDVEFYRPLPDTAGYRRIPPDNLTPQESDILSYVDQHGNITALEAEKVLSVKARRVREVLKEMTRKGLLEKRGSARSTSYVRV